MTVKKLIKILEMYEPKLPVQIGRIAPGGTWFHDNIIRISKVNYEAKNVILFVPEVFAYGERQYKTTGGM